MGDWPKVKLVKTGLGVNSTTLTIDGLELPVLSFSIAAGVDDIPRCTVTFECELDADAG